MPIGPLASGQFGGSPALDLVAGGRDTALVYLYIGHGDGSFSAPSSVVRIAGAVGGLADVAAADLDGDGALDVVTTNPGSRLVATVMGDGLGDLRAGPTLMLESTPGRLLLADVTGDGHPDALVATDSGVVVLRGAGDGSFAVLKTIVTQAPVADLALADLDGDGHADLIVALPGLNQIEIDRGDGAGDFALTASVTLPDPTAVAVGDFTGDSRLDVVVSSGSDDNGAAVGGDRQRPGGADGAGHGPAGDRAGCHGYRRRRPRGCHRARCAVGRGGDCARRRYGGNRGAADGGDRRRRGDAGDCGGRLRRHGLPDVALSVPDSQQVIVGLSAPECTGDCNVDQVVTINELITAVTIALGTEPLAQCERADASHDGTVSITELITAVSYSLNGCP